MAFPLVGSSLAAPVLVVDQVVIADPATSTWATAAPTPANRTGVPIEMGAVPARSVLQVNATTRSWTLAVPFPRSAPTIYGGMNAVEPFFGVRTWIVAAGHAITASVRVLGDLALPITVKSTGFVGWGVSI